MKFFCTMKFFLGLDNAKNCTKYLEFHIINNIISIIMWDVFFSFFVITALALLFAHAWNMFVETLLGTWVITDADGNVRDPVLQTLTYAIVMTIICISVLFIIHRYTDIDLGAGRRMRHRSKQSSDT